MCLCGDKGKVSQPLCMFLVYICEFKIAVNRENTPQVLNLCLPFTGASLNMDAKVKSCCVSTPCPLCFGPKRNNANFAKFQSLHHFFNKYITIEPFIFGTLGDLNAPK